eukprot:4794813-Amphidinium_carterae.1
MGTQITNPTAGEYRPPDQRYKRGLGSRDAWKPTYSRHWDWSSRGYTHGSQGRSEKPAWQGQGTKKQQRLVIHIL